MTKTYVNVGDTVFMRIGYSEAATHLGVAGSKRAVTLVSNYSAQLLNADGTEFSFPITSGEAGIYTEYVYDNGGNIIDRKHYVTGNTPVVDSYDELVVR